MAFVHSRTHKDHWCAAVAICYYKGMSLEPPFLTTPPGDRTGTRGTLPGNQISPGAISTTLTNGFRPLIERTWQGLAKNSTSIISNSH
jgi:hypothetical protein